MPLSFHRITKNAGTSIGEVCIILAFTLGKADIKRLWYHKFCISMPFKTRKQKGSAAVRKFTFSDGRISIADLDNKNISIEKGIKREILPGLEKKDNLYLKWDLLKIVIISAVIISAQVALRLTLS